MRFVRWLYPGLGIKRWLLLAIVGGAIFVNGAYRWVVAEGVQLPFNQWIDDLFDGLIPLAWLPAIFMIVGIVLFGISFIQWMNSIVLAITPERKDKVFQALFDMRLRRGYRIVAIGGGTGLSTLLRGLKRYTSNITAIVTVSDDGGSSGRLQKELGILPPGDIRNCLVALADDEALVTDLFRYRFTEGDGLSGHSFGNLFLAAMTGITGDFDQAIKESSHVLNIKGRVLPATLDSVRLRATLTDGSVVVGETAISQSKHPISEISFDTADEPRALPEVLSAIREADAIVLGPGSLFTSILPNLLVRGIAMELAASTKPRIYVCNVMTQPGETDGFSASDHVDALLKHSGARVCDRVIVNVDTPHRLLEAYALEGQVPVVPDIAEIEKLGVRVIRGSVMSETDTVRHDPARLADAIARVIDQNAAERASFVKLPAPAVKAANG